MTPNISERAFEDVIECALLRHGPDECPDDGTEVRESPPPYDVGLVPGGYLKRRPEDYDRILSLTPSDVVDFILATQPREWQRLRQHHGADLLHLSFGLDGTRRRHAQADRVAVARRRCQVIPARYKPARAATSLALPS